MISSLISNCTYYYYEIQNYKTYRLEVHYWQHPVPEAVVPGKMDYSGTPAHSLYSRTANCTSGCRVRRAGTPRTPGVPAPARGSAGSAPQCVGRAGFWPQIGRKCPGGWEQVVEWAHHGVLWAGSDDDGGCGDLNGGTYGSSVFFHFDGGGSPHPLLLLPCCLIVYMAHYGREVLSCPQQQYSLSRQPVIL